MKTICCFSNIHAALWAGRNLILASLFVVLGMACPKAHGQAAQTAFSQVGSTDVWELSFTEEVQLAGVTYYIGVSGYDPSVILSVPDNSWLFEPSETNLDVGEPVEESGYLWFPITAWRNDNEPQQGEGLYLEAEVDGGVIIAIEDFPTKAAFTNGNAQSQVADHSLQSYMQSATRVEIYDIQFISVSRLDAPHLDAQWKTLWRDLKPGFYLATIQMKDGTQATVKFAR